MFGGKYTGFKMLREWNNTGLQHVHRDFVTCTDYWVILKEGKYKQSEHLNVNLMVQVNSGLIKSTVVFNCINSATLTDQIIAPHTISHNEEAHICPS